MARMARRIETGLTAEILDSLKAKKLDFISVEYSRHGKPTIYVRKNGKRIQIKSYPLSAEFFKDYGEALGNLNGIKKDISLDSQTLSWLVKKYYDSADFKRLELSTQQVRKRVLEKILQEHGDKRYKLMSRSDVEAIKNEKADKLLPEAANHRVRYIRQVFKFGVDRGYCEQDPTLYVRREGQVNHKDKRGEVYKGHYTWRVEEIDQFFDHWKSGTREHLAMSLLFYAGVRISDLTRLGCQHEKDNRLIFKTVKKVGGSPKEAPTAVQMNIPIVPELRKAIDAHPRNNLAFITTQQGKSFSQKSISSWFSERCKMAGLQKYCTAHGVRKASATIAAQGGATGRELMAMYGWKTSKQADVYTREASKEILSNSGMAKLDLQRERSRN